MPCNATIITGTGRAGTSFLVGLLSVLGLPTGFPVNVVETVLYRTESHAGLEIIPRVHNGSIVCPRGVEIFKAPRLLKENYWMTANNIRFIVVPMRSEVESSESRKHQSLHHDPRRGLLQKDVQSQIRSDEHEISTFFWRVSNILRTNVVLLSYPLHVLDRNYSYSKLRPLLDAYNVSEDKFREAHQSLAKEELVHNYTSQKIR